MAGTEIVFKQATHANSAWPFLRGYAQGVLAVVTPNCEFTELLVYYIIVDKRHLLLTEPACRWIWVIC